MPKIDQLRARPEYAGLPDEAIVKSLALDYPDVPPEKIAADLGVKLPDPAVEGRTLGGTLKDFGISALQGAISVPDTIVGAGDLVSGGGLGNFLQDHGYRSKEAQQILQDSYSAPQQAAFKEVQDAHGVFDITKAALSNPSVIAHSVVQSLPAMGLGGVAARGILGIGARVLAPEALAAGGMGPMAVPGALTRALGSEATAAGAAGAVGEGLTMAGQDAEQIRQDTGTMTPDQMKDVAGIGLTGAGFAMLGAQVAKKLGIHDVDTMIAAGHANPQAQAGFVKRILEGAFSEGVLEELPQSIAEQVFLNHAEGKPLNDGVDNAAVMGLLAGAAMGAGGNALGGHTAPNPAPGAGSQPLSTPGTPDAQQSLPLPPTGPLAAAATAAAMAVTPMAPVSADSLHDAVRAGVEVHNEQPTAKELQDKKDSELRLEAIKNGTAPQPVHPALTEPDPFDFTQPLPSEQVSDHDAQVYADATGGTAETVHKPTVVPGTVDEGAHEAATSPLNDKQATPAQILGGNAELGHTKVGGLDVSIENPAGSVRTDLKNEPPQWSTQMQDHYGYIKKTEGADGDHVDAYIRKGTPTDYNGPVYVVDQINQHDGSFDEHKVMLGFANRGAAVNAYKAHYQQGWRMGRVTEMPMDGFKDWLKNGDTTKPASPKGALNATTTEQAGAAQQPGAVAATAASTAPVEAAGLNQGVTDASANPQAVPDAGGQQLSGATGTQLPTGPQAVAPVEGKAPAAPAPSTAPASAPAPAPVAGERVAQEAPQARWTRMTATEREALIAQRTAAKKPGLIATRAWNDLAPSWHKAIERAMKEHDAAAPVESTTAPAGAIEVSQSSEPIARSKANQELLDMVNAPGKQDVNFRATVDGKEAGYLDLAVGPDGKTAEVREVKVAPEHRRKGVATALYDKARAAGYTVARSEHQTDEGSAFRDAYDRRAQSGTQVSEGSLDDFNNALRENAPAKPAEPAEKFYASIAAAEDALKAAGRDTHQIVRDRRGLVVRPKVQENAAAGPVDSERLQSAHIGGVQAGPAPDSTAAATPQESGKPAGTSAAPQPAALAAPASSTATPETPPTRGSVTPSGNTIFTDDAYAKAREVLRRKLGTLNSGIDPELLQAGITAAGWHVEKGARTFAAFAKAMLADLGENIRPYLKSWYLAVAFDPRAEEFKGMDDPASVAKADISALGETGDASLSEPSANRIPVVSRLFGDGPERQALIEKGFEGLGVKDQQRVLTQMQRGILDLDVRQAIIESVPVEMMRMLVGRENSPKVLLNDESVLANALSIPRDAPIPAPVARVIDTLASSMKFEGATAGAEGQTTRSNVGGATVAGGAAQNANDGGHGLNGTHPRGTSLTAYLANKIASGQMPKDNPALKKLVEAYDRQDATPERMKQAQEHLEAAIAEHARSITEGKGDDRSKFDKLLALYESQPNLNVRTSTSIENQAYSTPAPLAFLASRLAGVTDQTRVLEPTAGTGMLLMQASPKNAIVNELNPERAALLKDQGFKVTQRDATMSLAAPGSVDAVITNPPFGSLHDEGGKTRKVEVDGYKVGQVDHLIAARALETMKDDGHAVLILGANKVTGGQSTDDRIFFNWLYSHYNVSSHFEVDGKLYTRQGASWPVRIITIDGRQSSDAFAPKEGTIQRVDTWEQVYGQFQQALAASGQRADTAATASTGRPGAEQAGKVAVPGPAGAATASTGEPGPAGSTQRNGDVPGAGTGPVADRRGVRTERLGDANRNERPSPAAPVSDRLEPAGQPDSTAADHPAPSAGSAAQLSSADNQFQTKYVPRSSVKDEGVLIPVNMAQPLQEALSKLEDEVGDIDQFAAKELGYKSVEELHKALMGLQVDSVASAIHQIKSGKALIIADQTGIGKGRQAAAIIRWAVKAGKTPVFFTVKPALFTDMLVEDLRGIGADKMVQPFVMNVNEPIRDHDGTVLHVTTPAERKRAIEAMQGNAMPAGKNAVFVTYSQINTENDQRGALTGIAGNAVFVLDESHNAGGESGTGEFVRSLLDLGQGTVYLSATYAKRPDNMPLYFKTDMGEAVGDNDTLMDAMSNGGLPLQTVVSNNLVKAGQMFRRERSFDGINIVSRVNTAQKAEHTKLSDATTQALRAIVQADKAFHSIYFDAIAKEVKEEGKQAKAAGNQAQRRVDHTEFSSVVHNFVRQMLLGLNVDEAANSAIAAIQAGQKPVIAVENTMGSFLTEYANKNGLQAGHPLGDYGYRTVLSRALERTRYYTEKDRQGNEQKIYVPIEKLDPVSRARYDHAQQIIDALDIPIPASPIDWMRYRLEQAGHSVAEITGRTLAVDYSNPAQPKLAEVPKPEREDKVLTTRRFNGLAGQPLDAIILNVSGSTGISLHASEKFKDQKPRKMIVAQAAQDINILMQMLGRVHRTGQVNLPSYEFLNPDLPATIRPMALTSKKMKSLNANTSSNTESATSVEAVDLLNKYGDQVVGDYLRDNRQLAHDLGLSEVLAGEDNPQDLARKATGRLALMPVATQRAFYDDVEQHYNTLIDFLNRTNQNELEPRTFDFDAKELKSQTIFEGTNPDSPFGENAHYGEYSIKAQGKPMTPDEIRAEMAQHLGGNDANVHAGDIVRTLTPAFDKMRSGLTDPEAQVFADNVARTGREFIQDHPIGSKFRVDINGDTYNAVVTNLRSTWKDGKPGNPFALSKLHVTIAVNGGLRHLTMAATQFSKIETSRHPHYSSVDQLFRVATLDREVAKIITGNLLGAYGELKGTRGTIISFTKEDGTSELGILLPKAFSMAENAKGGYRLRSGSDVVRFLTQSGAKDIDKLGVSTRDGVLRITANYGGDITIRVPKSKARGGKYFLDKNIRAVTGDFTSVGDRMTVTVPAAKAPAAIDALMKKGAIYALESHSETARSMFGNDKPMLRQGDQPVSVQPANAQHVGELQQHVDSLREGFKHSPDIVVLPSVASAGTPAEVLREARKVIEAGGGMPEGVFYVDPKRGPTVYLFADRITDTAKATEVVYHEVLGHYGLRGAFGAELGSILKQVAAARAADINRIIQRNGFNESERLRAAEELLAHMAETTPQLGFVRRAIAAIKTALRKAGLLDASKMSDDEIIRSYILPARAFVTGGDPALSAGSTAFSQGERGMRTVQVDGVRRPDSNSMGQIITPMTQGMQGLINFWRWFRDSKAVDDKGRPLVVYHGSTRTGITTFNTEHGGSYFTDKADLASAYSYGRGLSTASDGGAVYPVYLNLKNPLVIDAAGKRNDNIPVPWQKWNPKVFGNLPPNAVSLRAAFDRAIKDGHDGLIVHNVIDTPHGDGRDKSTIYVVQNPEQIKSATGNNGQYDPSSSNILFSQSGVNDPRDFFQSAMDGTMERLKELSDTPGKLNAWHTTLGTPYNLAERSKPFKAVYDRIQNFLRDVSQYATEAADLAPRILPKLDSWKDAFKKPLSAADTKALSAPLFEGTLSYTRDRTNNRPVAVADLEAKYEALDVHKRASMLLGSQQITEGDLKRVQNLGIDAYESYINSRFEREFMAPGIVWTPEELKSRYLMTDDQVGLYQEARASIDKSIQNLVLSDMLRYAGKDAEPLRGIIMAAPTLEEASDTLSQYLLSLAPTGDQRSAQLTDTAAKIVAKAQRGQELMDKGYAPLTRFGKYIVDVVDTDGKRVYFGMFENRMEARRAAAKMRDLFPGAAVTRGTTSQEGYKLYQGMTPETAELFGEMLGLEADGEGAANAAFQKYLKETKASRSAMKRLIERKGIAGYSEDVGRVLASFVYSNARQTANALHAKDISQAVEAIPQGQGDLKDAAIRLQKYTLEPQEEAVGLKNLLFANYLGGSVAAMMVNMTQPFAVTAPYLTQFANVATVGRAMAAATRDVWKASTGDQALDIALKMAAERGDVAPQEVHQLMAQARGKASLLAGDGTTTGNVLARIKNAASRTAFLWGQPFAIAELFNRRLTFIAAYRIAVERGEADPSAFAVKAIDDTQFKYNKGNKPEWARGTLGGILFTFKQYSISYLELVHRMWSQGGPEGKKAALMTLGMLLLMGGAGGFPFADDLSDLADGIGQRLGYNTRSRRWRQEALKSILGETLGNFADKGLTGLPGMPVDVSSRFGMGNLIPGTGLLTMKKDHTSDVLEIAGPTGDLGKRVFQGVNDAAAGRPMKGALDAAPKAIGNLAQAYQMAMLGYYTDQNGNKVIDTNLGEAAAKAIGFQPKSVSEIQQNGHDVQQMKEVAQMKQSEFADALARARFQKDTVAAQSVMDEIKAWNAANPESPIRVSPQVVNQKVRRMNETKEQRLVAASPKAMRGEVRKELLSSKP